MWYSVNRRSEDDRKALDFPLWSMDRNLLAEILAEDHNDWQGCPSLDWQWSHVYLWDTDGAFIGQWNVERTWEGVPSHGFKSVARASRMAIGSEPGLDLNKEMVSNKTTEGGEKMTGGKMFRLVTDWLKTDENDRVDEARINLYKGEPNGVSFSYYPDPDDDEELYEVSLSLAPNKRYLFTVEHYEEDVYTMIIYTESNSLDLFQTLWEQFLKEIE